MTRRALLLHGLSSEPSGWWFIRSALEAEGWDVTAPPLLGHGGSAGGDRYALDDYVAALLEGAGERAGEEPWDLVVGHSLGGAVAVLAASADPDWARRVLLIDPVLVIEPGELEGIVADQVSELDLTDDAIRADHPLWHDRDVAAKLLGVRSVVPDAVTRTFRDTVVARGSWDLRGAAATLEAPTLVLAADPEAGAMFSARLAAELATTNPLIETRVIVGAGHSVHRDRPDETLAALHGWLAAG